MRSAPPALLESPLKRRTVATRLESLLERYALIVEWCEAESRARAETGRRLLLDHPTGLREALEIDVHEARDRERASRDVLERVRAAAPLPPAELASRRFLALAELEALVLGLRRQRRALRRGRTTAWEPELAPMGDELQSLAEGPPSLWLGTLTSWLAERFEAPAWWAWFWGPRGIEVDVGGTADFPEGQPVRVDGPEGPTLVLRQGDRWYAASAVCPHRGGDLTEGEAEGSVVICPVHAWAFSLEDGATPADPRCRLPLCEVRIVEGRVYVRALTC